MTDIVDALLWHVKPEFFTTPFRGDDTGVIVTIGTIKEAADEIERLRAMLDEALAMLEIYYIPNSDGTTPTITRIKSLLQQGSEPCR